ncbi:MAG: hypothetical protein RI930_46 [Pseudomonadota bacterium]|jgi:hypothetical protein
MTIKVNYDIETTLVKGYYPDSINYASIPEPFIEIEDDAQDNSKQMCVIDEIYQEYVTPTNVLLAEAKAAKIAQLKANRNAALGKPYAACKAYEWDKPEIEENEVYFEFSVEATGVQLTEPNTIIFGASLGSIIKYSCIIIEGENRREGYIILNQAVAQNISAHLTDRGTIYVAYANDKEVEINACTTLEELNTININFE